MADERGAWNDFLFLEVNPAFVEQTGMEDPVGRKATELLGTPDPHWAEVYGRVAETGEPVRLEQDERTLGRVFDLYVFRLGDAGSRRVAVLFTDITGRKRHEQRQAFLLKLSDTLRPLADPVEVQAAACRLLGEHLGVDRAYYVEVNEAESYARVERDYLRGDSPSLAGTFRLVDYGWIIPFLRRGESAIVENAQTSDLVPAADREAMAAVGIAAHVSAPLIKEGALVGALCVTEAAPRGWSDAEAELVRETAERIWAAVQRARAEVALLELNATLERRVEERTRELRYSEQRFSQAFHANPIPACMTTLGRETFVEVNAAFLALTGYTREEVAGKSSRELQMWSSPEDQKKLGEAQDGGRGFHNLELRLRTKGGEARDILISAAVIQLNGEPGYLRMFYDVTEQRRTQEQMHRAIQEVMSDTGWFSSRVLEQLAHIKTGSAEVLVPVDLSRREREVLERLAGGMGNDLIAKDLGLSQQTIRNYLSTLYSKLGIHSRAEAVIWARERGVVGG